MTRRGPSSRPRLSGESPRRSSAAQLPPAAALIHTETLGAQVAWVARRAALPQAAPAPLQLELIYKALSLQPRAMLAALGDMR